MSFLREFYEDEVIAICKSVVAQIVATLAEDGKISIEQANIINKQVDEVDIPKLML